MGFKTIFNGKKSSYRFLLVSFELVILIHTSVKFKTRLHIRKGDISRIFFFSFLFCKIEKNELCFIFMLSYRRERKKKTLDKQHAKWYVPFMEIGLEMDFISWNPGYVPTGLQSLIMAISKRWLNIIWVESKKQKRGNSGIFFISH